MTALLGHFTYRGVRIDARKSSRGRRFYRHDNQPLSEIPNFNYAGFQSAMRRWAKKHEGHKA